MRITASCGKPLGIDLFCGLGGWTHGMIAEGYDVVGFDIVAHEYDGERYPARLVLHDVRDLHGSSFRDAALILASPPCQAYSFMAMPFRRGKQMAQEYREGIRSIAQLNELFDACFRVQREACDAAGNHIPMVVENVRGAEPWVGRAQAKFGSFYLWGDVPALLPSTVSRSGIKFGGTWFDVANPSPQRKVSSRSPARRAMQARIAKIPLLLASWIASVYKPR